MEKEFIEFVARHLVDAPDEVHLTAVEGEQSLILELKVAQDDIGKIIGKRGRIVSSIRTLLGAIATKSGKRVTLNILD